MRKYIIEGEEYEFIRMVNNDGWKAECKNSEGKTVLIEVNSKTEITKL